MHNTYFLCSDLFLLSLLPPYMAFCLLANSLSGPYSSFSLISFNFDHAPVAVLRSEARPTRQQKSMNMVVGLNCFEMPNSDAE